MLKRMLVIILSLLAGATLINAECKTFPLTAEPWKLKPISGNISKAMLSYNYDDSDWLTVEMPNQWQMLAQFENKYAGRMVYRYKFDFEPQPKKSYYLRFNGVFYRCNIWLNGWYLGRHEGYFAPFEFDVTNHLREKNVLVVEVICPYEKDIRHKKQIMGVFGQWDVINKHRSPGGIWLPVEIIETGKAHFRHLWIGTLALEGKNARILFYGEMRSKVLKVASYTITVDFEPYNFEGKSYHFEFELKGEPGVNYFKKEFVLKKPALWWTWDRGEPNLYAVRVKSILNGEVQDEAEFITGIRTIEKRCQKKVKKEGLCWQFYLNGKPIYIRGNNYAPSDVYLARTTKELIDKDIKLMKKSHYNMIRVHAHIDHPYLYQACDRAGILVWQDFPLQWGYDKSIWKSARKQAMEMVWLLGSHPSVVIWNCHNEPFSSPKSFLFGDWNVKKLDPELKRIISITDPSRPVNLASGLLNKTDCHMYLGWYLLKADDLAKFFELFPKWAAFFTEFGAQAFPNYESAIKFMNPDINKINWQKLEEYHMLQKKIMQKYVPLKPGMSLEDYINATQDYQARLLKYHIDQLRSRKYELNWGCIAFLFNDSIPAITWSVVDWWRQPKKGYYAIKQSFQPVYAMARWKFAPYKPKRKIKLPIYVVNDLLESYSATLTAEICFKGRKLVEKSWKVELSPDMPATLIDTISFIPEKEGDYQLKLTLNAQGLKTPSENITILKVRKK